MFKICTHYLNDDHDPDVHEYDFDDYNEAIKRFAYEIVANDSVTMAYNVINRGYDYINVSLWKMTGGVNERLAHWAKAFF